MKLSQIEANWIASKLLSDAERERERAAERRTAWRAVLFPGLKRVRPTERLALLRRTAQRAAREPLIWVPAVIAWIVYAALYIWVPKQSRPVWLEFSPVAILVGYWVALYLRIRAILSRTAR